MLLFRTILANILFLIALTASSSVLSSNADNADLDDESYDDGIPDSYWDKPEDDEPEKPVDLPVYPLEKNLLSVDMDLNLFPYTVFIDETSLTVSEDQVIRYTVVLRSKSGAENIFYEGVRCTQHMMQRVAYGSADRFVRAQNTKWRYIRKSKQDRYIDHLVNEFFCPFPGRDARAEILRKLRRSGMQRFLYDGDE